MFWRLYIEYAAIFCLLFLGSLVLLHSQTQKQNKEHTQQTANSLSTYSDGLFQECQNLAVSIGRCEALLNLSSRNIASLDFAALDSTVFFTAQHNLVSYKALNRYISSIDVYLYDREYIVSDHGTVTLESFCQSIFGMEADKCSDYLSPLKSGRLIFLPAGAIPETDLPVAPLYILSLTNNSNTRYGNLILTLNVQEMAQDVETRLGPGMEYFLFDRDKNLILTNHASEVYDAQLYDSSLSDRRLSFLPENSNGFCGFVYYPPSFLKRQLLVSSLLLGGILLLIMAGLVPLSHAICRKNYAPIQELASIINHADAREAKNEPARELEYEALKNAISSVFANKALLEEQIFVYKPLLVSSLLLELLSDPAPDYDTVLAGLGNLGITFPFPEFLCVSCLTEQMRPEFPQETAGKAEGDACLCRFFSCRKHVNVFFLNFAHAEDGREALALLSRILEAESFVCSYGIGGMVQGLTYAHTSYAQSLCALEYLSTVPSAKGVAYDSLVQARVLSQAAPESLPSLSAAFLAGGFTDALEHLEQYFQKAGSSGFVSKNSLLSVKEQIAAALSALPKELAPDTDALLSYEPVRSGDFELLGELCRKLCLELDSLARRQKEESSADSSRLLLSYLEEHLCDEELSLSTLADAFQISESSMSRRIKQLTGDTFLSYITSRRIQHACLLLKTTDLPISAIAKASGYENDVTFRRLFKKHTGITPGNYRTQHAGQ